MVCVAGATAAAADAAPPPVADTRPRQCAARRSGRWWHGAVDARVRMVVTEHLAAMFARDIPRLIAQHPYVSAGRLRVGGDRALQVTGSLREVGGGGGSGGGGQRVLGGS